MIVTPASFSLKGKPSFIVFEGINGAGKSTLSKSISDFLRSKNFSIVETREPGGTELGALLRKVVQETPGLSPDPLSELLMFSADRAEHVRKLIRPSLSSGKWVLCDRYFYSSLVFQGYGRGMDRSVIAAVTKIAIDETVPKLVVLVDIAPEEALNRLSARDGREVGLKDRFEREGMDFHKRIREGFLTVAHESSEPFLVLDGMKSPDDLFSQVKSALGVS